MPLPYNSTDEPIGDYFLIKPEELEEK